MRDGIRGADDGTEDGRRFNAPLTAKPIHCIAEDQSGPEMALGYAARVPLDAIGHEDEQMRPGGEHASAQPSPRFANRDRRRDAVETPAGIREDIA